MRHRSGRASHISSGVIAHDVDSASREGSCPIRFSVRRPCQQASSPPHDTMAGDGEVVALLRPDVIDDLREAVRQGHASDVAATALLYGMESAGGRAGGTACVAARTSPAEQASAFLSDVSGRRWRGPAEFQDEDRGDEVADPRDGAQTLDTGIVLPALSDRGRVRRSEHQAAAAGRGSLGGRCRDRRQQQAFNLALAASSEPACSPS